MGEKTLLENAGDVAADAVAAKAKARISQARGSVDSAGKNPEEKIVSLQDKQKEKQAKELQKVLDNLYKPENFAPLMRAPADIMLAVTGDEVWNVGEKEMAVLSASAANTARYFLAADPKWIALTMFITALTTTYGSRTLMYMKKRKKNEPPKTTN